MPPLFLRVNLDLITVYLSFILLSVHYNPLSSLGWLIADLILALCFSINNSRLLIGNHWYSVLCQCASPNISTARIITWEDVCFLACSKTFHHVIMNDFCSQVEHHPLLVHLPAPHIWQLTPSFASQASSTTTASLISNAISDLLLSSCIGTPYERGSGWWWCLDINQGRLELSGWPVPLGFERRFLWWTVSNHCHDR